MSTPGNDYEGEADASPDLLVMAGPQRRPAMEAEELAEINLGAVSSNAGATDPAKTPRGEEPPALNTTTNLAGTLALSNDATPIAHPDYFVSRLPPPLSRADTASTNSNVSSPLQSAGASSSSLHSSAPVSAPAGPADSKELYSRLIKVQSRSGVTRSATSGSTSNPSAGPSRPTTKSNRLDGPQYPDQSFAALHRQAFTPPYPYLRSNSPYTSHGSHTSASPSNLSQEHLHLPGVSRTEGNTPVESPGLFDSASVLSRRGRDGEEMESSQYKAPSLHPTYHMGPKESHSLRKDFDAMTGHKLINNYEVLRELGKGTHGKVKLARPLGTHDDDKVAIKIVKRFRQKRLKLGGRETQEDRVKKEIAVLKKARHHHVVSLLEVIDDPDADKVYMVLEYVEEGEMKWRRKGDRWTVDFERRRIERERAAWNNNETIDLDTFAAEVDEFNRQRETRAAEKRRDLARQKQRAYDLISSPSRRSSTATILTDDESHSRILAAKWSLEHGGDSDDETTQQAHIDRTPSSVSLAGSLPAHNSPGDFVDFQPEGGLESSTILMNPFNLASAPMSPLLGHGVSHASGSQLSDAIETDRTFLAALKQIQREEDLNTFDREDKPYRHVPCLNMNRCRECFRDTVLGLEYLHYQGIIHRDIKPANLLWDKQHRVKISDFGVSYLGHSPRLDDDDDREPGVQGDDEVDLAKTVGTPAFYAPELCDPDLFADGRDNRRQIGSAMDVWALGVTLYCMIFARLPFDDLDNNEMNLFHKIAKEEVFIPRMRPRAVRLRKTDGYEPKDRDEDELEYEAIGDELHDLLKRLLHKNPVQRITIPEIKRHPWVVERMENLVEWLDETDPANYISDKKIRVTKEDVSAAMQPISFVERMKQGVKRLSSLVRGEKPRGRDMRQRTHRNGEKSVSGSSRASTGPSADPSSRRSSLRGDELAHALRASRPETEHPLSQSQVASPVHDLHESYFQSPSAPQTSAITPVQIRPSPMPRGGSTSESIMTVRAVKSRNDMRWQSPFEAMPDTSYPPTSAVPVSGSTNVYGKSFSKRPSHGLASQRSSLSTYSETSGTSSDNLSGSFDDAAAHASPSIAMSSATATGRVAPPSVLHEPSTSSSPSRPLPTHHQTKRPPHQRQKSQPQASNRPRAASALVSPLSGTVGNRQDSETSLRRTQEATMRREGQDWLTRIEAAESSRPSSRGVVPDCPPSPDDELWAQQRSHPQGRVSGRPRSVTSTGAAYGSRHSAASSSDDFPNPVFSDNSRHPSVPSAISSIGSGSARDFEEGFDMSKISRLNALAGAGKVNDSLMSTGETITPRMHAPISLMDTAETGIEKQWQRYGRRSQELAVPGNDEDEAGYVGDQDLDEDNDSDDDGIVFGGKHV